MNEVKNSNDSEKLTSQEKLELLKMKIKSQRSEAIKLLKTGSGIRNRIYELLLNLSDKHRIENIDDVCDFMEEIEEKYGLTSKEDSDMSLLYTELQNENMKETVEKKAQIAKQGDDSIVTEVTNSDEEIFCNSDVDSEVVIKTAEDRITLYKELLHNMENSNYEYKLLLERLQEIQKRRDEATKQGKVSQAKHPWIEDYR